MPINKPIPPIPSLPLIQQRRINVESRPPLSVGKNRSIGEYQILNQDSPAALTSEVQQSIAAGWQPYGPPLAHGATLAQCVVRYAAGSPRR